jgi:hypothetical protein
MTRVVREVPPLRLSARIVTPSGRRYRWAQDERLPENVLSDLVFSSTMPGGFENLSCKLARRPSRDYGDLDRLSTITIFGPGGSVRGEYRLEDTPRASGDQFAITPQAVGWQAALDDNELPGYVYVDSDPNSWGDMPLNQKLQAGAWDLQTLSWATGFGGLTAAAPIQSITQALAEAWYSAPSGALIGKVMYIGSDVSLPAGWEAPTLRLAPGDTSAGADAYAETFDSTLRSRVPTTPRRYALWRYISSSAAVTPAAGTLRSVKVIAVYGNHGLPDYAIDANTPNGLLASDIEAHALGKWAPVLNFTTGPGGTIAPSGFLIVHLTFPGLVKVSDIVKGATRFELRDWAVWENLTYYSNDRGARGRKWRARVGPSQLKETGPQLARLFNAVIVSYQDVTGVTKTAGPPGSGCDTEDASLADTDPSNPCNQRGIVRCQPLQIGVSTPAGAIGYGARYWADVKAVDNSGEAQIVGYVEDSSGVIHAASEIRAGDQIAFTDAHDPSYRFIARAEYTDSSKTCQVSLDAPPDGMQQLLERYNEVLAPLGIGS